MERKSLKELKKLLNIRNTRLDETIKVFSNNDNPQILERLHKAQGQKDIIDDILKYIETGEKHWINY